MAQKTIFQTDTASDATGKINDNFEELYDGQGSAINSDKTIIRVMTWNVGHFSVGKSSSPTITNTNYEEKLTAWRKIINSVCANVLLLQEYDPDFGSHTVDGNTVVETAKDAVFHQYFPFDSIGTKESSDAYPCNTIYAKQALTDPETPEVYYETHFQNTYFRITSLSLGGKTVKLVSTHLDWNNSTLRYAQITQLINAVGNEDYIIIGGDWNISDTNEFNPFFDAGFSAANHGMFGDILTYPATGANQFNTNIVASRTTPDKLLDNIFFKGFEIINVRLVDEGTLTDHCGIVCDLIML